jgi:hypothetical protein
VTPEERRKNQRSNQDFFSEKLSELCRYIGFGVIAVYFSVISQDGVFFDQMRANPELVRSAAFYAGLVVTFDFIQMICGYVSSSIAAESVHNQFKMNRTSKAFRSIQNLMFFGKLLACLSACFFILRSFGFSLA